MAAPAFLINETHANTQTHIKSVPISAGGSPPQSRVRPPATLPNGRAPGALVYLFEAYGAGCQPRKTPTAPRHEASSQLLHDMDERARVDTHLAKLHEVHNRSTNRKCVVGGSVVQKMG